MKFRHFGYLAIVLGICLPLAKAAQPLPAVSSVQKPVTNEYHGTRVVDSYQWLEEASAPEARE